jgi:rare lipoprotein A
MHKKHKLFICRLALAAVICIPLSGTPVLASGTGQDFSSEFSGHVSSNQEENTVQALKESPTESPDTSGEFFSEQPDVTGDKFMVAEGRASYYANKFHGRRTASGEHFDKHDYTAAHRSLPFGTKVKVTNLANGRNVVVRINDRGPFKKSRIIDISPAAAKDIGIVSSGIGNVRIEAYN